jgi:hypothetical protein
MKRQVQIQIHIQHKFCMLILCTNTIHTCSTFFLSFLLSFFLPSFLPCLLACLISLFLSLEYSTDGGSFTSGGDNDPMYGMEYGPGGSRPNGVGSGQGRGQGQGQGQGKGATKGYGTSPNQYHVSPTPRRYRTP